MILATFLLTKVEVGARVEAALQNFAAGLIISAGTTTVCNFEFDFELIFALYRFISGR